MPPSKITELASGTEEILKQGGDKIKKIILFGSRAKGTATPQSDYDICIVGKRLKRLKAPRKFQLHVFEKEAPEEILMDGVVLVEKDG